MFPPCCWSSSCLIGFRQVTWHPLKGHDLGGELDLHYDIFDLFVSSVTQEMSRYVYIVYMYSFGMLFLSLKNSQYDTLLCLITYLWPLRAKASIWVGLGCSGSVQHPHLHQAASATLPLETSPTHMLGSTRSGHISRIE